MAIHLMIAPAASGKTHRCIQRLKELRASASAGPLAPVWVCLPNALQVSAFRARLAAEGGLLGIRSGAFGSFYRDLLSRGPLIPRPQLAAAAQYRVLRVLAEEAARRGELPHYGPIAAKPGFCQELLSLIRELKALYIRPAELARLWGDGAPAQRDLAALYARYQGWLEAHGWADEEELGWQALDALDESPDLGRDLALLLVDGFDHLDEVQLRALARLGQRVGELCITLTGQAGPARLAQRRFDRAREALEARLGVSPTYEDAEARLHPALARLERHIFDIAPPHLPDGQGAIAFLEATDPPGEAREALRWLKARVVQDGYSPGQVALLARDLGPYRSYLREAAAEFGLPLRLADQEPLASNPCIAALLDLLALALRDWPWRQVVDAWRSPYLDWGGLGVEIAPADADRLAAAAHWGQVVQGRAAWQETLARLARPIAEAAGDDESREAPFPPEEGQRLLSLWQGFVRAVEPPPLGTVAEQIRWVEERIGPLPDEEDEGEGGASLRLGQRAQHPDPAIQRRDERALHAFKEVLRGLWLAAETVGAAEAVGAADPAPYARFWADLSGAVAAATYALPEDDDGPGARSILASDVHHARGLAFDAVALIGLAEGAFPRPRREDPLFPDAERERLGAPLESEEPTLFYEAITRARSHLLFTRPRLAEDGAPWEPSPFWEAARGLLDAPDVRVVRAGQPREGDAASAAEWLLTLAASGAAADASTPDWNAADWEHVAWGAEIWRARQAPEPQGAHEGDAAALAPALAARYGPAHTWSASQLEAYGSCPFRFYVSYALGLEPVAPPAEGLDFAQLGSLYHRLLEQCYRRARPDFSLEALLAALAELAPAELQAAPERYGFRPTGWWALHQEEVQRDVEATLRALAELGGYAPLRLEQPYGYGKWPPLLLADPASSDEPIRLRGYIDRIDASPAGHLRVIDYKSFGAASTIAARHLLEGTRLQLPLYALAAEEALGLGQVRAGFYWLVRQGEASSLRLEGYGEGPEDAARQASDHVRRYVAAIRAGEFPPHPPADGCPGYCPAAAFCWRLGQRNSWR